jgi:hypothetical protein
MTDELSAFLSSIRFVPPHEVPRERLHELPLLRETLDRWPQIRCVVANGLVAARVETDQWPHVEIHYDHAFEITAFWDELQFPEGVAGRAIMISFDGGQYPGSIMVKFSNWQLTSIEVDHTGDFFCPLSDRFQQINLLPL